MWVRKKKNENVYFEFDFGIGKIIQGTKFFDPILELNIPKKFGLKQIHSSIIVEALTDEAIGDGIYTKRNNEFIYVKTADCLPCAFVNREKRILAVFHIGWRGTYLKIIQRFIGKFLFEYRIYPKEWEVIFGSFIKPKDYIIGDDLKELLKISRISGIIEDGKNTYLDLLKANIEILVENGIRKYYTFPECEEGLFFSHRKGEKGRNIFGGYLY